jgi:hypothetical protein
LVSGRGPRHLLDRSLHELCIHLSQKYKTSEAVFGMLLFDIERRCGLLHPRFVEQTISLALGFFFLMCWMELLVLALTEICSSEISR